MESRRSMGMSKPWTQPKRSSSTGIGTSASGSSGASGMSKLPKLKLTGPSSSQKPTRSSSVSSEMQSGARRATSATRSPSKNKTPMRASRNLVRNDSVVLYFFALWKNIKFFYGSSKCPTVSLMDHKTKCYGSMASDSSQGLFQTKIVHILAYKWF